MTHVSMDFLALRRKRARKRRMIRRLGILLLVIVVVLGVPSLVYASRIRSVYRLGMEGKHDLGNAKAALLAQDFPAASKHLQSASNHLHDAVAAMTRLGGLKVLPILGNQVRAMNGILVVGAQAATAAQSLTELAARVTMPIQKNGHTTFASISVKEKREMLELVSTTEPELQGAKAELDLAVAALETIPRRGLLGPLATLSDELRTQLPAAGKTVEQTIPLVRVLPAMLGYPSARSYLFLLQNNTELRPTGGFIGTYGVLNVKDGDIANFLTDNVYNLDKPAEAYLNIAPPAPLKKYLYADRYFLRDANWSPDFPTAAKNVLHFYDLEKRGHPPIDGVIAVTPTFISSLMQLTGPITIDGLTFTDENLVDMLQEQVEKGFLRQGIPESERKEIIGTLSKVLFDKLLKLPTSKLQDVLKTFEENVREKHLLLYFRDEEEQTRSRDLKWSGELQTTDDDFVMVVDANLASLKSDPGVQRGLSYSVTRDGESLIASLSISYDNQGTFNWKSTRYRTYTRVYVPKGSELLSASGYLTNDKTKGGRETQPTVEEELGKTVLAGFTAIEPKEQKTLTLQYRLPAALAERFKNGTYELHVQKQPGTTAHGLTLDISTQSRLQSYSPQDCSSESGHLRCTMDLRQDRAFTLQFQP